MICFLNSKVLGYENFTIQPLSMQGGLDLKSLDSSLSALWCEAKISPHSHPITFAGQGKPTQGGSSEAGQNCHPWTKDSVVNRRQCMRGVNLGQQNCAQCHSFTSYGFVVVSWWIAFQRKREREEELKKKKKKKSYYKTKIVIYVQ